MSAITKAPGIESAEQRQTRLELASLYAAVTKYQLSGQIEDEVKTLRRIDAMAPSENPFVLMRLAKIYSDEGDLRASYQSLREVINPTPKPNTSISSSFQRDPLIVTCFANLCGKLGRSSERMQALRQAVYLETHDRTSICTRLFEQLSQDQSPTHLYAGALAACAFEVQTPAEKLSYAAQAVHIAPDLPLARCIYAWFLKEGSWQDSMDQAWKADQLASYDVEPLVQEFREKNSLSTGAIIVITDPKTHVTTITRKSYSPKGPVEEPQVQEDFEVSLPDVYHVKKIALKP